MVISSFPPCERQEMARSDLAGETVEEVVLVSVDFRKLVLKK